MKSQKKNNNNKIHSIIRMEKIFFRKFDLRCVKLSGLKTKKKISESKQIRIFLF